VKLLGSLHRWFDTRMMLSKKTARMGDEGKAVGCVPLTALLFLALDVQSGGLVGAHSTTHALQSPRAFAREALMPLLPFKNALRSVRLMP
jgi:hypothetical protein